MRIITSNQGWGYPGIHQDAFSDQSRAHSGHGAMMLTATSCPKCHFEFSLPALAPLPAPAVMPPAVMPQVPPRLCVCACACPTSVPAGGSVITLSVNTCAWTPRLEPKLCVPPPPLTLNPTKARKDLMTGGGIIHVASGPNAGPPPPTPTTPPSTPLSLAALLTPSVLTSSGLTQTVFTPSVAAKRPPLPVVPPPTPAPVAAPVSAPAPVPIPIGLARTLPLPDLEFTMLNSTMRTLQTCGWYYERFSWQDSVAALCQSAEGTFLVRDSSDPRFLFSLSVQTVRGPTSVRLHYVAGGFRLDALPHLANDMPVFPCVVPLIEHYARKCAHQSDHVLVDAKSQMHSSIRLTLPRRTQVPSLQHLARLAINRTLRSDLAGKLKEVDKLPLPHTVIDYLKEYPYTL